MILKRVFTLRCVGIAVLLCASFRAYAYAEHLFHTLEKTLGIEHKASYVFLDGLKPNLAFSDQIFFIYLPGDNLYRDFEHDNDCSWEYTPSFFKHLIHHTPQAVFIRMCPNVKSSIIQSLVYENADVDIGTKSIAEQKLEARVSDVIGLLDTLLAKGADPRKIFLFGHSFGGWVALSILKNQPLKLNCAVVSAPASSQRVDYARLHYESLLEKGICSQPNTGLERYVCKQGAKKSEQLKILLQKSSELYLDNYSQQKAQLSSGDSPLPVLVFAYPNDVYNKPEDLSWLLKIKGVDFAVESCDPDAGHSTFYSSCFEENNKDRILAFVHKHLTA